MPLAVKFGNTSLLRKKYFYDISLGFTAKYLMSQRFVWVWNESVCQKKRMYQNIFPYHTHKNLHPHLACSVCIGH